MNKAILITQLLFFCLSAVSQNDSIFKIDTLPYFNNCNDIQVIITYSDSPDKIINSYKINEKGEIVSEINNDNRLSIPQKLIYVKPNKNECITYRYFLNEADNDISRKIVEFNQDSSISKVVLLTYKTNTYQIWDKETEELLKNYAEIVMPTVSDTIINGNDTVINTISLGMEEFKKIHLIKEIKKTEKVLWRETKYYYYPNGLLKYTLKDDNFGEVDSICFYYNKKDSLKKKIDYFKYYRDNKYSVNYVENYKYKNNRHISTQISEHAIVQNSKFYKNGNISKSVISFNQRLNNTITENDIIPQKKVTFSDSSERLIYYDNMNRIIRIEKNRMGFKITNEYIYNTSYPIKLKVDFDEI